MKRRVVVTQTVEIEVDETKFTPEFMEEFRQDFYSFHDLDDHILHLGQLFARGILRSFTEGYGEIDDLGVRGREIECDMEFKDP